MADVESAIRAVEERLWKAQLSGDFEALDGLIADDLLFTGHTRVWILEGGRWQIAGGHMSVVPQRASPLLPAFRAFVGVACEAEGGPEEATQSVGVSQTVPVATSAS